MGLFDFLKKKNHPKEIAIGENTLSIEELREKFENDLIGTWSVPGSFSSVMNEIWEFFPDLRGRKTSICAMSGEEIEEFEWKHNGKQSILINVPMADEADDEWVVYNYDFSSIANDICTHNLLVSVVNGEIKDTFDCLFPLQFISDVQR